MISATKKFTLLAAAAVIGLALAAWGGAKVYPAFWGAECGGAPVAGASGSLPHLRFLRRLPAPNKYYWLFNAVSGTGNLVWSPDGERLAAYARNAYSVMVWSPDGKIERELPRAIGEAWNRDGVLGFLSAHDRLLTGPALLHEDPRVHDVAFSVLDAETGKVLRQVVGPTPGGPFQLNLADKGLVSPDQRFVAVAYQYFGDANQEPRIGVFATDDWRRVALLSVGEPGDDGDRRKAIAFSPDGKLFAIGYTNKVGSNIRADIFDTESWRLIRTIRAFPDIPKGEIYSVKDVMFSGDGSMIAVFLDRGGVYWKDANGKSAPKGEGTMFKWGITEPLRVFKTSDGSLVASAGGFAASLNLHEITWSPEISLIAFLDQDNYLYFWNPISGDAPREMCRLFRSTSSIAFSPDGKLFGQGFGDGVNLYEVID